MPLRNKDFHECGGIPVWGHQRNLRVQEGLAAAPMFPVAVPVAAADPFLQKSHAIPRSNNNRELKTAEYQRSDFKPEIQSRELHAKLLRRRQGPAAAPVGGGGHCTRYVVMHPLRGPTPDQNGCNAYGSCAMPTDRVHRTTLEYPKEESAAPHTSPVDRNTRSHKNPKHRRCEGRRRDLPRCPWATAGPGCGAYGQQRHYRLPNFARNLSWSFFETPQKHCNSNDANSMFEGAAGELRARLLSIGARG